MAVAGPAVAQEPAAAPAEPARRGCFRPAAAPRCAWFTIVDAGVHRRLNDDPDDEATLFAWALGFMANTGPRTALGGEVFAGAEGELRGGVALRWRRWLTGRASLDLAAGVHLAGDASSGDVKPGSPMLQVKWMPTDLLGLSARLDVLRIEDPFTAGPTPGPAYTSERLYLGGELGSGLGVVGFAITAVVIGLAALAFAAAY